MHFSLLASHIASALAWIKSREQRAASSEQILLANDTERQSNVLDSDIVLGLSGTTANFVKITFIGEAGVRQAAKFFVQMAG